MSDKEAKGEIVRKGFEALVGGLIPGYGVLTSMVNFYADIKRERVLQFLDEFSIALGAITDKTQEEILAICTTEDFIDILDAVIQKVHMTKSELKIERFKNLLLKQVVDPEPDYLMSKYVGLIHELNDIQVCMLKRINNQSLEKDKSISLHFYLTYFGEYVVDNTDSIVIESVLSTTYNTDSIVIELTAEKTVNVNCHELQLYLNNLVSLGLVDLIVKTKLKHPRQGWVGEKVSLVEKESYKISNSGKLFLEHLTIKVD